MSSPSIDDESRDVEMVSFFSNEIDWTAAEYQINESPADRFLKKMRPSPRHGIVAAAGLLLIVACSLGFASESNWKSSPVFAKMSLPSHTVHKIDHDSASDQAKAYKWISSNYASSTLESMTTEELQQLYGLVVTYFALNGDGWYLPQMPQGGYCDWHGIDCSARGRVTGAKFTPKGNGGTARRGSIPSELADFLTSLSDLSVHGYPNLAAMDDALPSQMTTLHELRELKVSENVISGQIPSFLGELTKLSLLDLSKNKALSGTIPASLFSLKNLHRLKMDENKLKGGIPGKNMRLASHLVELDLQHNQLSGTLPSELGFLTSMTHLRIADNRITSTIPTQIGNMKRLAVLDLSSLDISGTIPTEIGRARSLLRLEMGHTKVEGTIPSELGLLHGVYRIDFAQTKLTGTVPTEIKKLSHLSGFCLENTTLAEFGSHCQFGGRR